MRYFSFRIWTLVFRFQKQQRCRANVAHPEPGQIVQGTEPPREPGPGSPATTNIVQGTEPPREPGPGSGSLRVSAESIVQGSEPPREPGPGSLGASIGLQSIVQGTEPPREPGPSGAKLHIAAHVDGFETRSGPPWDPDPGGPGREAENRNRHRERETWFAENAVGCRSPFSGRNSGVGGVDGGHRR